MTPTPPSTGRVRYQPAQRDPSIPPTMTVAVVVGYVRGCADCETIVATIARSCIPDPTCTSFKAVQGRQHAHDVAEGAQALPGLTTAPPEGIVGPEAFNPNERDPMLLPISDTNGTLGPDELPNGFDA